MEFLICMKYFFVLSIFVFQIKNMFFTFSYFLLLLEEKVNESVQPQLFRILSVIFKLIYFLMKHSVKSDISSTHSNVSINHFCDLAHPYKLLPSRYRRNEESVTFCCIFYTLIISFNIESKMANSTSNSFFNY